MNRAFVPPIPSSGLFAGRRLIADHVAVARTISTKDSKVKKLFLPAIVISLTGCSQFTTNDAEQDELLQQASQSADEYVSCIVTTAMGYGSRDAEEVPVLTRTAAADCDSQRQRYRDAQKTYLETRMMVTGSSVDTAEAELNQRAETEVARAMLEQPAAPPAAAAADSQAYVDCMVEQAQRYASQPESAADIATVAHEQCRGQLTGAAQAEEAEAQGRARAMQAVMDARLEAS